MEIPISCSKVWRRNLSADLYYTCTDFWIYDDYGGDFYRKNDEEEPVGAYHTFGKSRWLSFGGWINAIIPVLIVPYYSVIGGWVMKYLVEYIRGNGSKLASDGYFSDFISSGLSTEICFAFLRYLRWGLSLPASGMVLSGLSRFMMPVLVVLSILTTVYSVSRREH